MVHCGQLPSESGNCMLTPEISQARIESLSDAVLRDEQNSDHTYPDHTSHLRQYEIPALGYMAG